MVEILFGISIALIIVGVAGLIWRLFFAPHTSGDLSNLELYRLFSGDMKWLVAFQTAILAGLLMLIIAKL